MTTPWKQQPARTRGLVYLVGGVVLAVVCALVLRSFAETAAAAGVDVSDDRQAEGIGLLGAPLSFGMAGGIVLVYLGLVKVLLGARTDRLEWDRITGVGLLYILGFIGALVLTGYVALVRWRLHIF